LTGVPQRAAAARLAYDAACKTDDESQIVSALDAWLDLENKAQRVGQEIAAIRTQRSAGVLWDQFKREFPNARQVLLGACQFRLAQAKEKLAEVLAREQAHLQTYDGSGYDVNESQPVKRQASRVSWLEKIEKRIASESIEQTWTPFARELLK
jgi:hypothetical protein